MADFDYQTEMQLIPLRARILNISKQITVLEQQIDNKKNAKGGANPFYVKNDVKFMTANLDKLEKEIAALRAEFNEIKKEAK